MVPKEGWVMETQAELSCMHPTEQWIRMENKYESIDIWRILPLCTTVKQKAPTQKINVQSKTIINRHFII